MIKTFDINHKTYHYFSLQSLNADHVLKKLPVSIKILIENLLRQNTEDARQAIHNVLRFYEIDFQPFEIGFKPARVLCQDFTGVPAVVDLAAMRDACVALNKNPESVNPQIPVDLVIDHSVMVDRFGTDQAFDENVSFEYARNKERYEFLKWGQNAFKNFRVVPPGTGICHQVNLEYLSQVVWSEHKNDISVVYPDTLIGTDSHTTMVNGLAVLGWGVGGIEAEAAMLGQAVSMLIPDVVGMRLVGQLKEGVTATDLVLSIVNILRTKGVVGKFVEFYGSGLSHLPVADRATIANMAPEYGATCGFFPIDDETLKYMKLTGRSQEQIDLVKTYAQIQYMWRNDHDAPEFKDTITLDLSTIEPTLAGPKRPQDKILLKDAHRVAGNITPSDDRFIVKNKNFTLGHQDVVIAAITSCTNTSNPSVMMAAGLLAKKAHDLGLQVKPWVKTSLAPGSQVVHDYLERAQLMNALNALGFHIVGYGCATCIGNSGPLDEALQTCISDHQLDVAAVLSGNRNFEGRIHPDVKSSYLASPPLVVAYALAGTMKIDFQTQPLGMDVNHNPVYLRDIWPSSQEIQNHVSQYLDPIYFQKRYAHVFEGTQQWQTLNVPTSMTYTWNADSTYIKRPPYFDLSQDDKKQHHIVEQAQILGVFGDSITTDHISPAGHIKTHSPAGKYLSSRSVNSADFNSYGARRGHDEVMIRGTFANIRLQNEMTPQVTGGYTLCPVSSECVSIFDAAMTAQKHHTPLVIFAGSEYGTGSSRDWAAKGTRLLGVQVVIAESFERIHRSNLIGMGVLPVIFKAGENRRTLGITGKERISLRYHEKTLKPNCQLELEITYPDGKQYHTEVLNKIETLTELKYYQAGGILPYVLREQS